MKNVIYILIQCTWGLPQTLLGFIVLLINIKNKHYFYHGAIITERNVPSSVSLGMFVFTTTNPMKDKRTKNKIPDEELSKRLLVHEYGHTIQSLILDRKSTRLNSSHVSISYAVFCLKKKKKS